MLLENVVLGRVLVRSGLYFLNLYIVAGRRRTAQMQIWVSARFHSQKCTRVVWGLWKLSTYRQLLTSFQQSPAADHFSAISDKQTTPISKDTASAEENRRICIRFPQPDALAKQGPADSQSRSMHLFHAILNVDIYFAPCCAHLCILNERA